MTRMSPENIDNVVSSVKTKSMMVSELVQGRHSASELKLLLQRPFGSDDDDDDGPQAQAQAQAHLSQILRSFNQTISLLLPSSGENSSRRSAPETKDRRGCYKRRKTAHTWTKVSPTLEDDHAWRKYGQKQILHSKFPRSYFRCTRKHDQGCKAIKQVQRIEENPEMYEITYIGLHTCNKDILTASKLVVTDSGNWESFLNVPNNNESNNKVQRDDDDDDDDDEKVMMYGGTSDDPPLITTSSSTTTPTTTIKQEYPKDQDTPLSDVTDNLDPGLWSDFKDFELSNVSSNMASSSHHHHHAFFYGFGDYDFHFD